jgi:hypothetical protein
LEIIALPGVLALPVQSCSGLESLHEMAGLVSSATPESDHAAAHADAPEGRDLQIHSEQE